MGAYGHFALRGDDQLVGPGFFRNAVQQLAGRRLGGANHHGRLSGESNRLGGEIGLLGNRVHGR